MIDRYHSILRESAARQIMVNFHGANKPTGEARTWPHELTREGVFGLEHRQATEWARHNTTLPFTRFLAGAADYTPPPDQMELGRRLVAEYQIQKLTSCSTCHR